jgi:hypothetical protein
MKKLFLNFKIFDPFYLFNKTKGFIEFTLSYDFD